MQVNLFSKVKKGLKHPENAIKYLFLGKKDYHSFRKFKELEKLKKTETERLISIVSPSTPLEHCMVNHTDISDHLCTLYLLTIEFNLKKIIELGTRNGESTIALLQAAHEISGEVTSIDINSCSYAKNIINDLNLSDKWNFIQNDDLEIEWNQVIDHLFIDTSHTYEQTMAELKKYEPFVRSGGIITLHDMVGCPEVLIAINEYIQNREDIKFYKYFHNSGLGILKKR